MHHIYHTEGIILGNRNFGEAGKYYFVFTRDLGMIKASAQGVRKMSSKLRYILQDYAYVKIDLVKGKDFWRVTSASKTNMLDEMPRKKGGKVFARIAQLLKKLLAGEEANEILFQDLLSGLSILENSTNDRELDNLEAVLVLRILHNLGYLGENEVVDAFIRSPFEQDLIFAAAKNRPHIISQINKALKETHL